MLAILTVPRVYRYEEMILSRWPYIFVGCLAFVLIVIGLIVWRCCVARRKKREAKSNSMRLPDTRQRSPAAHQVSFMHANDSAMEMGDNKIHYDSMYHESEYRSSYGSGHPRV